MCHQKAKLSARCRGYGTAGEHHPTPSQPQDHGAATIAGAIGSTEAPAITAGASGGELFGDLLNCRATARHADRDSGDSKGGGDDAGDRLGERDPEERIERVRPWPGHPDGGSRDQVEERFAAWMSTQEQQSVLFTAVQVQWLTWMKENIASELGIGPDSFEYTPFAEHGGIGRAAQVFGDRLSPLMNELTEVLAA